MVSTAWTDQSKNSTAFTAASSVSTGFTLASIISTAFALALILSTKFTEWLDIDNTITTGDTTYTLASTVVLLDGELNTADPTYKNTVNWS